MDVVALNLPPPEQRPTVYTPVEFAELFGKEKSWTYRLAYKGAIEVIKGFGTMMIPADQVEAILNKRSRVRPAGDDQNA